MFDSMLDRIPSKAVREGSTHGRWALATAAAKLNGLGPRGLWAAAGMLVLGLVVAAVVIRVRTANGVIVLENVPADAVVEVDSLSSPGPAEEFLHNHLHGLIETV